ncbi:MAG: hypothetical protein HRU38_23490 [Saccharospirillaceae bacterium]|nr:hypothetical protein [Saccharospirillaceae bacterium]
MIKKLIQVRFALLLTVFGFTSAIALNKNIEAFKAFDYTVQALIVLIIAGIGLTLIWKDQTVT